jgi:hypothetical protein
MELSLGLQMPEIKKQLQQRAKTESCAELVSQSA